MASQVPQKTTLLEVLTVNVWVEQLRRPLTPPPPGRHYTRV